MLERVARHAQAYLDSLPERPVGVPVDPETLRAALAMPLADDGVAPEQVIDELVAGVDPGLVASAGPRYFGFVTGGALPAALAADWMAAAWDQNGFSYVASPAAAVVEEVVEGWLLDVLGLPSTASVGLVTGAQMANATCLAAARNTRARAGRLGRRARRADRRAADHDRRRRGGARDGLHARCGSSGSAWAPRAWSRSTTRARSTPASSNARRSRDRVRAGRQRQLRRVRPAGADRRRLRARRRLAARRRRVRAVGGREPDSKRTGARASSAPTRGPPTPTSGSTSRTTAGSRSSPTAPRTSARWACPPPT